jgi:hypothetical protein
MNFQQQTLMGSRKMTLPASANTCTLGQMFMFQSSPCAAARNAADSITSFPRREESAGKEPAPPELGPENRPNMHLPMKKNQSNILNSATRDGGLRSGVSRHLLAAALGLAVLLAGAGPARAGNLYVPNYSFESPDIGTNSPYAAPVLDSWQESPQPDWYDPADFEDTPWMEYAGTFYNVPNFTNIVFTNGAWITNSVDSYIYNCAGVQAAYLFAIPQVAISQVLNATFNAGKAYTLTVGLIGGGGDMAVGSTLQLSLYYLDGSGDMVTVGAATVTNTPGNFPGDANFVDFAVQVPGVNASDPWAGQNIGIQLLATPDPYDPMQWGGYWDADNVRLVETTALNLVNPAMTGGGLHLTVQSEPGVVFQILSTPDLGLPVAEWTRLGTLTNVTGRMPFVDSTTGPGQGFYTAQQSP